MNSSIYKDTHDYNDNNEQQCPNIPIGSIFDTEAVDTRIKRDAYPMLINGKDTGKSITGEHLDDRIEEINNYLQHKGYRGYYVRNTGSEITIEVKNQEMADTIINQLENDLEIK